MWYFLGLGPCIFSFLRRLVLVVILSQNEPISSVFKVWSWVYSPTSVISEVVWLLLFRIMGHTCCFTAYFDTFSQVVSDLESAAQTLTGVELVLLHAEFLFHIFIQEPCPFLDLVKAERKVRVDTILHPSCQQLPHLGYGILTFLRYDHHLEFHYSNSRCFDALHVSSEWWRPLILINQTPRDEHKRHPSFMFLNHFHFLIYGYRILGLLGSNSSNIRWRSCLFGGHPNSGKKEKNRLLALTKATDDSVPLHDGPDTISMQPPHPVPSIHLN